MLFDIIKSENSKLASYDNVYKNCIDCEKTARTRPFNIKARARKALEKFINAVLDLNGIEIPDDIDLKKEKKLDTLNDKIHLCIDNGFIDKCHMYDIDYVRKEGNDTVHDGDEYEEADKVLKSLYRVVASYATGKRIKNIAENEKTESFTTKTGYKVKGKEGYETEDLLPIGEYEVIKPMFAIGTDENKIKAYKCKKVSVFGDKTEVQYAIIKRFIKNATADITQFRDRMAMHTIKKYYNILERPPILAEEIETSDDSKYSFLCYLTSENTFLLNQKNSFRKYIESKSYKTENDKLCAKLSILKDIVEILNSLIDITENISVHHRNLRPDCIFLTPTHKGCSVNVGNFEYSKIMDSAETNEGAPTININAYSQKVKDDPFAPPEVKDASIKDIGTPDWEQVDVYACAKLALYILCGDAHTENIHKHLDTVSRDLSYEFYTITKDIIEKTYLSRPTLNEYLKVIKKEIIMLE